MAAPSWFPGHMLKATRDLQRVLKQVDIILEVRDARLPFTSANPDLAKLVGAKRRIVVLNKCDLADPRATRAAAALLEGDDKAAAGGGAAAATAAGGSMRRPRVAMTCVHKTKTVRELLQGALGWIQAERPVSGMSLLMVAGCPNTGKSALINAFKAAARSQGALSGQQAYNRRTETGDLPGLTRRMEGFQVSAAPEAYVLDTPGVLQQRIDGEVAGLRLSLAGIIKAAIVGDERTLSYLINQIRTVPRHRRELFAVAKRLAGREEVRQREADEEAQEAQQQQQVKPTAKRRKQDQGQKQAAAGKGDGQRRELLKMAQALLHAATAPLPQEPWHPGREDDEDTASAGGGSSGAGSSAGGVEARRRLDMLLEGLLGAEGAARDLSRRAAACSKVLKAFRTGELGRYTLDEV